MGNALWKQKGRTGMSSASSGVWINRQREACVRVEGGGISAGKDPGVARHRALLILLLMGCTARELGRTSLLLCRVALSFLLSSAQWTTALLLSALGLFTEGQPLQMDQKLRLALSEVGIVEMMQASVFVSGRTVKNLPEAVEVELADEAGKVGGLEGFIV